jgi:signal transduction histidine kinase
LQHREVHFKVDAALLRELGARLVGKPHIALAELIKNAYDADARHVRITFDETSIVVEDDGHGMSAETFETLWMRVGTTHKAKRRTSPELKRPLTGSKGVGRLAAQLLASSLDIESVALVHPELKGFAERSSASSADLHPMLTAAVRWDDAVREEELTEVTVPITEGGPRKTFVDGARTGTRLTLSRLTSAWSEDDFRSLAREIWALQPPFEVADDDERSFGIELRSEFDDVVEEFSNQMESIFDAWQGRVTMTLMDDEPNREVLFDFDALKDYDAEEDEVDADEEAGDGDESGSSSRGRRVRPGVGVSKLVKIDIELRDPREGIQHQYVRVPNCPVGSMSSDVRVFHLRNRQPHGIAVDDARDYMRAFGGVHIYDDHFRLPYYGPEDWLDIERDHARRLSMSQMVPAALRVSKGLHDLPTRQRLFGTTTISTAVEQRTATERGLTDTEALAIQVSRDRLADNIAYVGLRNIVRLGLDLYATEVARAKSVAPLVGNRRGSEPRPRPSRDLDAVGEVVTAARENLTSKQYESITDYLSVAKKTVQVIEDTADAQASLLGTLATVGMTTLAWEHETTKQRLVVLDAAGALKQALQADPETLRQVGTEQSERLLEAAQRMNDVARLFRPVMDRESRETRATLQARRFIERTTKQLSVLGRGAVVDTGGVPKGLRLPAGTFSAWTAIFQNLLVNAFNAVLEEPDTRIRIDGGESPTNGWVRIQDTGIGVDLDRAEDFFKPFVRGRADDDRRSQLGLGGSGLGLTIVRMIADAIGVRVRFVEPEGDYATAVMIDWKVAK